MAPLVWRDQQKAGGRPRYRQKNAAQAALPHSNGTEAPSPRYGHSFVFANASLAPDKALETETQTAARLWSYGGLCAVPHRGATGNWQVDDESESVEEPSVELTVCDELWVGVCHAYEQTCICVINLPLNTNTLSHHRATPPGLQRAAEGLDLALYHRHRPWAAVASPLRAGGPAPAARHGWGVGPRGLQVVRVRRVHL